MKRVVFVVGLTLLGLNTAQADFQAGLAAYNSKDYSKAVSLWQTDAAAGDHNAQYNLGLLYEKGVDGYPKNLAKAYGWYRLAASQNVPEATKAIERIKGLMTAGQIETGNEQALEIFGKWHRTNIGKDEAEYQLAKKDQEKQREVKIEAERLAAAERAKRQRNLISQRDADAKVAVALERESKQAAIKAAQEKAEEAKRLAFIEKRRKEEEKRLAVLKEEQKKQLKMTAARNRLEELRAKQAQGTSAAVAPVVSAAPAAPVEARPLDIKENTVAVENTPEPEIETNKTVVVAPTKVTPVAKSEPIIVTKTVVEAPAAKKEVETLKQKESPKQAPVVNSSAVAKTNSPATVTPVGNVTKPDSISAPEAPVIAASKPVQKVEKPTAPVVSSKSVKTPYKASVEPSNATVVAQKPAAMGKISLPVMTNGLDVAVVKEIVEKANSMPLDTGTAKQEISKGRTNIQALKWSLISAARGKGSAKQMNALLEKSMTSVQVAEANRLAADWINKRQKRQ